MLPGCACLKDGAGHLPKPLVIPVSRSVGIWKRSSAKKFHFILPRECHFYNLDPVCFLNYLTPTKITFSVSVSLLESGLERGQNEGQ